ncbi:glycoside hydrolase family 3 protein [Lachnoclostridium sp. Marseille-P6806]|uniref:glycoside hydrolase family 3 protein n=1 Tax=Lachnoclostridium sp. Marseille-P6806 TaxID=2364793 RepID=UPI001030D689|nr:glycoside hydrolase family 3 protein [Lachnoclostridium sp. Marseille-P6806]
MEMIRMSEREIRCADLAYCAAAEGMVLLENNGALPIEQSGKAALFGLGAVRTVRSGTGSGDPFNGGLSGGGRVDVDQSPRYHIHILDAFVAAGYEVTTERFLRRQAEPYDDAKSQLRPGMGTFFFPEPAVTEEMLREGGKGCDTAIYVITRNSGEGADRHMYGGSKEQRKARTIGDFALSETEAENLKKLRGAFRKLIVVLNVGGILDTKQIRGVNPDAILLMSLAGQEGGRAVRDVLNGTFDPSGKLTDTWAENYEDYPASKTFGDENRDIDLEKYEEGIFVGYRYFDLKKTKPAYPFGYGLSYTSFEVGDITFTLQGRIVTLHAAVTNVGNCAGREVWQVYTRICPEANGIVQPVKALAGFAKTRLLMPGQSQVLEVKVEMDDLASFLETNQSYTLLAGNYLFLTGTRSDRLTAVYRVKVESDQVISFVSKILPVELPFAEPVSYNVMTADELSVPELILKSEAETADLRMPDVPVATYLTPDQAAAYETVLDYDRPVNTGRTDKIMFSGVAAGRAAMAEFIAQLSDLDLARINTGTGWGVADENNPIVGENSESVPGAAGETTRMLEEEYGVPSIIMADGPGGVRVRQDFEAFNQVTGQKETVCHYATAWPVGTLLAQSFDEELLRKVGRAFAEEMKDIGVHILLGPGMNIHRDPLCGRNFEYFSEDPLVTGLCGAAFVEGLQDGTVVGGCIKHYAANNQETNRSGVDEIISQRALREIYLKGFEIAVKKAAPWAIMTAYNKINHVPCADSRDLCNVAARNEWGFKGLIMTDWNGGSSHASVSMHAGNDLIMPGGPSKQKEILLAYHHIDPAFDERGQVRMTKPVNVMPFYEADWNSFEVSEYGSDIVTAPIGEEHHAEIKDGQILVDGEAIFRKATPPREMFRNHDACPFSTPVTTEVASLSEDGRSIIYKGVWHDEKTITRGDLQDCAMHILEIVRRASCAGGEQ